MLKASRSAFAAIALAAALVATPALAKSGSIHLPDGATMATVGGHVERGKAQGWRINGKEGQTFSVAVESSGNGAMLQIRQPDKTAGYLPGAAPKDEIRKWTGKLPTGGTYLVEVVALNPDADYTLRVEIK